MSDNHLDDLTAEQWSEVREVVREVCRDAISGMNAGRSSMPIDIDSALMLSAIAASAASAAEAAR